MRLSLSSNSNERPARGCEPMCWPFGWALSERDIRGCCHCDGALDRFDARIAVLCLFDFFAGGCRKVFTGKHLRQICVGLA
jgi:hypothetical protein